MLFSSVSVDGPLTWDKVKVLYKEVASKTNATDPSKLKASRGWMFGCGFQQSITIGVFSDTLWKTYGL